MNRLHFSLSLLCIFALAGCERELTPVAEQSLRPAKLYRVTTGSDLGSHLFVGRVEAAQSIDLSFEVAGELLELSLREGQKLPTGSLVARLDPRDYELALQEAEVQLRLASQDLKRKESLLRQKSIPVSLVDDAKAEHDLWQVRLAKAKEQLADTKLTAPFEAYIARRYVDNRSRVQVGEPIVRLLDLNELKVIVSIPAELLATITPPQIESISARFDFLPDQNFPLRIRENRGEASTLAQTYEVSFTLQRPQMVNILPGMTAQVQVDVKAPPQSSIRIPASALVSDPEGILSVWVYDPQTDLVQRRNVSVGNPLPNGVAITSGLSEGELLVVAGANQLQDGMRIRPQGEPATGN